MSVKVEISDARASYLREDAQQRMIALRAEADELERFVASIDAQLNGKLTVALPEAWKTGVTQGASKRKKGENLRTILMFLKAVHINGATVAEISTRTGLPISSCMAVLKRHGDTFAKGGDGLWRCRPKQL